MANGTAWLSKGVESLRERLLATQGERWDCDVLVIGSGYGGAVAAARLAGRRIDGRPTEVWVLERGREWSSQQTGFSFQSDPASTSVSLYAIIGHERNGVFFKG